jgi:hypothetical protein
MNSSSRNQELRVALVRLYLSSALIVLAFETEQALKKQTAEVPR